MIAANDNKPSAAFKVGKTYSYRFATNHSMIVDLQVVRRTKCFVTFDDGKRFKVHNRGDGEFCLLGNYSMAPVVRANKGV